MKKLVSRCLSCGSGVISTESDVVAPVFRMDIVRYACGAVLKSTTGDRGRLGRLSHEGCGWESFEAAP